MTSTAETLMRLASEADAKADDLLERLSVTLTAEDDAELENRAAFYRGQASGMRQAAFYAAISEGTNAND